MTRLKLLEKSYIVIYTIFIEFHKSAVNAITDVRSGIFFYKEDIICIQLHLVMGPDYWNPT